MTIFDVIRHSPLRLSIDLFNQLPFPATKKWVADCYDNHLVMFNIADTQNKKYRNEVIKRIKEESEQHWFIKSIIAKGCEEEAIAQLTKILMELK